MRDRDFSQLLMLGILGETLSEYEVAAFKRYPPGGVILFARNCADPGKTRALIDEVQQLSLTVSGLPLIVAIDQEGGRVRRLKRGFPDLPGAEKLGVEDDLAKTCSTAAKLAQELLEIGINCNLAPVADLFNDASQVLSGRCFGSEPERVAEHVTKFIAGLQAAGVAACVKHFPGHGSVAEDSHKMLPVSSLSRLELAPHLKPFADAIDSGVKLMMVAHISFPRIDALSVPFSPLFLQDIARLELGFSGVLISDDLDMAAVSGRPLPQVMVSALEAGLDMALWGRNLKPVVDPGPVCAEFCRQMAASFLQKAELSAKFKRVRRLREEFYGKG